MAPDNFELVEAIYDEEDPPDTPDAQAAPVEIERRWWKKRPSLWLWLEGNTVRGAITRVGRKWHGQIEGQPECPPQRTCAKAKQFVELTAMIAAKLQ